MATPSSPTVTRSRYNIWGDASGIANPIVYFGPTVDLDSPDSQVTSANTLRVTRFNETTGAEEHYTPGGGSNDFHTLDRGSLDGGVAVGQGLGRVYVIFAKADFVLDHACPA